MQSDRKEEGLLSISKIQHPFSPMLVTSRSEQNICRQIQRSSSMASPNFGQDFKSPKQQIDKTQSYKSSFAQRMALAQRQQQRYNSEVVINRLSGRTFQDYEHLDEKIEIDVNEVPNYQAHRDSQRSEKINEFFQKSRIYNDSTNNGRQYKYDDFERETEQNNVTKKLQYSNKHHATISLVDLQSEKQRSQPQFLDDIESIPDPSRRKTQELNTYRHQHHSRLYQQMEIKQGELGESNSEQNIRKVKFSTIQENQNERKERPQIYLNKETFKDAYKTEEHQQTQNCALCLINGKQAEYEIKQLQEQNQGLKNIVEEFEKQLIIQTNKMSQMENNIMNYQNKHKMSENKYNELIKQYRERCRLIEESLRKETSMNEKQRAEISVLKVNLEKGVKNLGISFQNNQQHMIQNLQRQQSGQTPTKDGYLRLIQQEQIIDQLKEKIETLNEKYETAETKNEELVENLHISKQNELEIIEEHYVNLIENQNIFQQELQQDKKNLLADKVQLQSIIDEHSTQMILKENLMKEKDIEILKNTDNLNFVRKKKDEIELTLKVQEAQILELKEKIDELKNNTKESQSEQKEQRNQIQQDAIERESSKKAMEQIDLLLDSKSKQVQELNDLICKLQSHKDEIQSKIEKLIQQNHKIVQKNNKMSKQMKDLNSVAKQHVQMNIELKESKNALKESLQTTQAELVRLIKYLQQIEANKHITESDQIHGLNIKVNQLEAIKDQYSILQADHKQTLEKQQQIEKCIEQYKINDTKMKKEKEEKNLLNYKLSVLTTEQNQQLNKLKLQNNEMTKENKQLNQNIQQVKTTNKETFDLKYQFEMENKNLKESQSNLQVLNEELRSKNQQLMMEKSELTQQLNKLQMELEKLELNHKPALNVLHAEDPNVTFNILSKQNEQKQQQILNNEINLLQGDLSYFCKSIALIENLEERYGLLNQFLQTHNRNNKLKTNLNDAINFVILLRDSFNQVFQTLFQMELNIERCNPLNNLEIKNFEIQKSFEIQENQNLRKLLTQIVKIESLSESKRKIITNIDHEITFLKQLNHQSMKINKQLNLKNSEQETQILEQQQKQCQNQINKSRFLINQQIINIGAEDNLGLAKLITASQIYKDLENQKDKCRNQIVQMESNIISLKEQNEQLKLKQNQNCMVCISKQNDQSEHINVQQSAYQIKPYVECELSQKMLTLDNQINKPNLQANNISRNEFLNCEIQNETAKSYQSLISIKEKSKRASKYRKKAESQQKYVILEQSESDYDLPYQSPKTSSRLDQRLKVESPIDQTRINQNNKGHLNKSNSALELIENPISSTIKKQFKKHQNHSFQHKEEAEHMTKQPIVDKEEKILKGKSYKREQVSRNTSNLITNPSSITKIEPGISINYDETKSGINKCEQQKENLMENTCKDSIYEEVSMNSLARGNQQVVDTAETHREQESYQYSISDSKVMGQISINNQKFKVVRDQSINQTKVQYSQKQILDNHLMMILNQIQKQNKDTASATLGQFDFKKSNESIDTQKLLKLCEQNNKKMRQHEGVFDKHINNRILISETNISKFESNINSQEKEKSFYKDVSNRIVGNLGEFTSQIDLIQEQRQIEQNDEICDNEKRMFDIDVDMDEFEIENQSQLINTQIKVLLDNTDENNDDFKNMSIKTFSQHSQNDKSLGNSAGPRSGDFQSQISCKSQIEEIEEDFEEQMRSFERQVTQFDQTLSVKELKMIR